MKLITYATFSLKKNVNSKIKKAIGASRISSLQKIKATQPFRGYNEASSCGGTCYGEGEYKVFYGKDNTSIKKPFVIVDGFDPNDVRKINTTDNNIFSEMIYKDNDNNEVNLVNELQGLGYDVIILNFPLYVIKTITRDDYSCLTGGPQTTYKTYRDGGADYVERNGKVLQALLEEIKGKLIANESTEKIKIAGPSMAALVVQYALVDMEKNNKNHHTDLFVSFDGPHKGANAPIGMQKWLEYFNIQAGLSALNSPAAKQMLLNHYLSNTEGPPQGAPNFRNRFQNMMNSLGFPKQAKNVAIINGSVIGKNTATAGTNMAYADLTAFWRFLRRSLWVDYTTSSGKRQVFRYLKKNWWGAHTQSDTRKYSTTSSSYGSLDNASGGFFDVKGTAENALGGSFPYYFNGGNHNIPNLNQLIKENPGYGDFAIFGAQMLTQLISLHAYINLTDNFSFVPTKSALAYTGVNKKWNEQIGCRNMVCTNETPFDSYYAPKENQPHASLHNEGITWLLKAAEAVNNNTDLPKPSIYTTCSTTTNSISINGSSKLCAGQTATYTINNCDSSNATWVTSSNLQVISSNNQQISVKNVNANNASTWVRVSINGKSDTKTILGKPAIYYTVAQGSYPRITVLGSGIPVNQQGIYTTQWVKTGGNGYIQNTNSFSTYARGSGSNWNVSGYVKVTNSCGTTAKKFYIKGGKSIEPCEDFKFKKVANNKYKIVEPCEEELRMPSLSANAEVYNLYGIKVNVPIINNVIDLSSNSKGEIRVLKAIVKGKLITKTIITD